MTDTATIVLKTGADRERAMTFAPLLCEWTGEAFKPLGRYASDADKSLVVGERYKIAEAADRSANSHNHFFASLAESWRNLPEHLAERFDTPEKLRKFALIRSGYADQRQIFCASKAEAQRVAAFIRPMDEYAVVTVSEAVVTVYTAQSQSMRAMGKKEFQDSKTKVLDFVAGMIGVSPAELQANTGKAA